MKAKDVPQDDANMLQGKLREPIYSLDENGNYTTVQSVGWNPKNEVMKEAWDQVNEKVEHARNKVLSGEMSPLGYYIEKNIMDIGLVAKYMGIWRWTVKRHLKPNIFARLKEETLEKYAQVFNITKEQLIDTNLIKTEK
ncbi:MAG: hypothetical protein COW63_14465 [Bacteroidetes bacterium CG18_big_fil_WC_8_21_14_2_50_41_14]|nr:MAG: hypothetical protein COW63_14465 [Bacteroidetes bacterium CG18_big_fil_WC_8_21_14_2_50_41_14]PJB56163.1 MAG: hypothetical protein CO098_14750 [Bacteroidetes bacterium CG_4_9_14_3_um_filter_41_19]